MLLYTIILLFSFDVAFAAIGGQYIQEPIPFMAMLGNRRRSCGGAIVNSKWILSSASCAVRYEEKPENLTVRVGLAYLLEGGQKFQAMKVIIYPDFTTTGYNDLSLIRLDGEIKFDEKSQAMQFPQANTLAGAKLQGYGFESEDPHSPRLSQIQRINVTAISNAKCDKMIKRKVTKEVICTLSDVKLSGLCDGDIGGPLVNKNNEVVGIITIPRCSASATSASRYMRTFYYKDWILKNTKD